MKEMIENYGVMIVTMGQVGQLVFLQDSLYLLTGPSSTIHSQCVHTSTIILSPACTNTLYLEGTRAELSKCVTRNKASIAFLNDSPLSPCD